LRLPSDPFYLIVGSTAISIQHCSRQPAGSATSLGLKPRSLGVSWLRLDINDGRFDEETEHEFGVAHLAHEQVIVLLYIRLQEALQARL